MKKLLRSLIVWLVCVLPCFGASGATEGSNGDDELPLMLVVILFLIVGAVVAYLANRSKFVKGKKGEEE